MTKCVKCLNMCCALSRGFIRIIYAQGPITRHFTYIATYIHTYIQTVYREIFVLNIVHVTIICVDNFSRIHCTDRSEFCICHFFTNTPTQLLQEKSSCCRPTMAMENVSTCLLRSALSHHVLNMLLPFLEPLRSLDDDEDWYVVS